MPKFLLCVMHDPCAALAQYDLAFDLIACRIMRVIALIGKVILKNINIYGPNSCLNNF